MLLQNANWVNLQSDFVTAKKCMWLFFCDRTNKCPIKITFTHLPNLVRHCPMSDSNLQPWNGTNVVNFSIGTILEWSTLGYCNLNTYENEEVAFIGQRSSEPLKWWQFDEISKDTISKINTLHCLTTWWNLVEIFFSPLWWCKSTTTGWYLRDSAKIANKTAKYSWNRVFVGAE
jgi:hypothetical protein